MARKELDNNRRKQKRAKTHSNVTVMTPQLSLKATLKNISGDGMEIDSSTCLNPRTEIVVTLELEKDKKLKEIIEFRGKIVWTLSDYVKDRFVYRMGAQTSTITYKNKIADTFQARADLVQELLTKLENHAKEENF